MTPRYFKTLWGAVGSTAPYATFADVIPAVVDEGWDGVAFALIALEFEPDIGSLDELAERCDDAGLDLAVMVMTDGVTVADHLASFRRELDRVVGLGPHHVISHSGLDRFSTAEAVEFFTQAQAIERDIGVPIAHETHRTRIMFTPWATAAVLDEVPDLHLAVDLSHWMVVAERPLHDELDIIRRVGERMIHLDARVGYEEGPQIPDPTAPEWSGHVEMFTDWWEELLAARKIDAPLVVVPEYGPPPYQQTLPHTGEPTSDLWATCRHERDRLAAHWSD